MLELLNYSIKNHLMKEKLLNKAYEHCVKNGHRFTEPRERVLKILIEEAKPLSAYDILRKLSDQIENPKPPTVYRAIQFWHQEGFVHCIDSLKAYVVCLHSHHIGQAQFLVCNQCDFVQELECDLDFSSVMLATNEFQFSIVSCTVEIKGLCFQCSAKSGKNLSN